jgi:hypothetical protein
VNTTEKLPDTTAQVSPAVESAGSSEGQLTDEQEKSPLTGDITNTTETTNNATVTDRQVIKNTGFNLNSIVILIIGIGILMMVGIFVTIRYNYFAQSDE